MRVLHTNMLRGWGGQSNRILVEALGARRHGVDIAFAVPHDSVLAAKARDAGMRVFPGYRFKPPAQVWRFLPDLLRFRRDIAAFCPDLIHVHGSQDTWLVVIAKSLARGPFPTILRTKHNIFDWKRHAPNRWLYRRIDAFLSISSAIDAQLADYPGIGTKPRTTIFSVPDLSAILAPPSSNVRQEFAHLPPGTFLWGSTGRLRWEKGFDILLQALALLRQTHPHAHLAIAGDGSDRGALDAQAKRLGLGPEAVTFMGFRKDVPAILRALDAYVLASRSEGLGTAILEALAAGLPVVATKVGGIPDSVRHESTGILCEPDNPKDLAEKMARIMADAPLRTRLGTAAKAMVLTEFTEETLAQQTATFYRRLVPSAN